MSGHSKWSTIKRQKGAADIKRGQTFTKIANAITIAARTGSARLNTIIEEARSVNMPKENVQRAIDRGLGKLPGQTIEEVIYEGFGPGKIAYIVEGVTDNKLRTNQEVKYLFDRAGGNLGSTAYMFDKVGEIKVGSKGGLKDDEILELIDLGAQDVEDFEEEGKTIFIVYTTPSSLSNIAHSIKEGGFEVLSEDLSMKPNIITKIEDKETAEKVIKFTESLEDLDDVQKVHANFDIPEGLV